MREPEIHPAAELRIGMSAEFERDVTEDDIMAFAQTSGDYNPLHIDPAYAAHTNYGRRIVHGAYQVGLASAMLGMHLPGRNALMTLTNAQFPAPLYFPARVRVRGEIIAWNPSTRGGRLRVVINEQSTQVVTAEVGVGFTLHEDASHTAQGPLPRAPVTTPVVDRPTVIVTGASGGIGSELVRTLVGEYRIVALRHRTSMGDGLESSGHLQSVPLDLSDMSWPEALGDVLGDAPVYAIIHCAWPGLPHGSLLRTPTSTIQSQLSFGSIHLIEMARLLASRIPSQGGRLVAFGSIAGGQKPTPTRAAYSLGKAAVEHTVRLLAAELASKKITVNAICPGFVPLGMNRHADERRQKIEAAQVPLGRLCQPEDVVNAVSWLLSPGAAFVSGQIIGLTGAQL